VEATVTKEGRSKMLWTLMRCPAIVDEKSRTGGWEIDTVKCIKRKQALVTIIEKKSKFTVMKEVENKTAELVAAATIELLRPYKDHVLLTFTKVKSYSGVLNLRLIKE